MQTYVNPRGQIPIPAFVRRKFGIEAKTQILLDGDAQRKCVILTPLTRKHIQSLRGKYKNRGLLKAWMSEKARG